MDAETPESDALVQAMADFIRKWAIPGQERSMAVDLVGVSRAASAMTMKACEAGMKAAIVQAVDYIRRGGNAQSAKS